MEERSEPVTDASNVRENKRRPFLTLSLLLHAAFFAYWVYVHVHESSLFTIAESIAGGEYDFSRTLEFPGRWKYLTIVNMVSAFVV